MISSEPAVFGSAFFVSVSAESGLSFWSGPSAGLGSAGEEMMRRRGRNLGPDDSGYFQSAAVGLFRPQ